MGVRIKICGVTTVEAAEAASALGADAVGFVFADSPRQVNIDTALQLARPLSPMITRVAVFRYPSAASVRDVLRHFQPDIIQTEPSVDVTDAIGDLARLLPVFHDSQDLAERVAIYTADRAPGDAVLLEGQGRGGRGEPPSWERAADVARVTPLVLAGGLAPHNVVDAILKVRPHAVDVSSGVESKPGIKDPGLIAQFIEAARRAERQMETTMELPR